ncbi:PEGA domain-containing protein, partial [Myxococcus sp. CA039A]|uniref:PEGA domain-containing protein n=1 Tax=Myxococcus sp. CA039A TaxID=2741737 RepID=UPI00157A4028
PPPPPPEPEGMSTGKKVAFVAVPLVLLGIGAAVVLGGGQGGSKQPATQVVEVPRDRPTSPSGATTPVDAAPQALRVKFNSTPSGAAIYEGEEQIGTTPIELMLPREKSHQLSFRLANHKSEERSLNFSRVAGDSQTVDVTLEPIRAATPPKPKAPRPANTGQDINVFE